MSVVSDRPGIDTRQNASNDITTPTRKTLVVAFVLVAAALVMVIPLRAIGVALGGDRGGDIGATVWKLMIVVGSVALLWTVLGSSFRRTLHRRNDEPTAHDGDDLMTVRPDDH